MKNIINAGLIGFGGAGKVFHEPIITSIDGLNLYKVYERKPENIEVLLKRHPLVKVTSDRNEIFEDENIQLIILAVPNTVHYELAKKALENGKNVVVEKPFTVTSEEADSLIKLAKEKNKLLTIHHNRRWDSDFTTIQKVVQSNLLGDVVEYEAHYDRFRNFFKENAWRESDLPGSGILYDLGSHLIDQSQCLFGLPEEIFANLLIQRQGGKTVDNFEVILRYPQVKVTLKAGMLVRTPGPHFTILGTKGSFIKYGMDVQEESLKAGIKPNEVEVWGKEPESLWGSVNTEIDGLHVDGKIESDVGDYREFYKNVYNAVLGEEELKVTPEQARNTIRIIELAEKSSREGRWIKFE